MSFSKPENKLFDDLSQPLDLETLDKSLWNDKCDYYDVQECKNLNASNFNLVIL